MLLEPEDIFNFLCERIIYSRIFGQKKAQVGSPGF
jgi:hypothetical protein